MVPSRLPILDAPLRPTTTLAAARAAGESCPLQRPGGSTGCWTVKPCLVRRGPLIRGHSAAQLSRKHSPRGGSRQSTAVQSPSKKRISSMSTTLLARSPVDRLRSEPELLASANVSSPTTAAHDVVAMLSDARGSTMASTFSSSLGNGAAGAASSPAASTQAAFLRSIGSEDGAATQRTFPSRPSSSPAHLRASRQTRPSSPLKRNSISRQDSGAVEAQRTARPNSSPALSSTAVTARNSLVPNLPQSKIDAFVVDKLRQRTHPPMLRDHLQLHILLQGEDYKRCIAIVMECLKQGEEKTPGNEDESPEEAAIRMSQIECSLVGQIDDANVRKVLLLWILGVSLEAVGELRTAILMFSRCLALDPTNPVHFYHRACCLLRLNNQKPACADFDMAVQLCIAADTRPPLVFLANRALAGAALNDRERQPEVWADFELARQRANNPDLPIRLIARRVDTFEAYKEMLSTAVTVDAVHRHWASVLVARCHMKYEESVSDMESMSFVRYLRGLHGMASMTEAVVMRRFSEFSIRHIIEGQVLLLENFWYCILDGQVDVVRFGRPPPPGEAHIALNMDRYKNSEETQHDLEDPLRMPKSLEEVPQLQVVQTLPENSTFRGGDTFGPLDDGWLVAGAGGVELLCLNLRLMKQFEKRCGGLQKQVEADVQLLENSALFKGCPAHVLLTFVSEIFEHKEALTGEDPIADWDGLVVIRKGQLQLWADPVPKMTLGGTLGRDTMASFASSVRQGAPSSQPTSCASSVIGATIGSGSPRTSASEELCVLGPGDALGEEKLLDGSPGLCFTRSKVLSHRLEAWVLPPSRKGDAEDIGLMATLRANRDTKRRELQERAKAANTWARLRPQALAIAKTTRRTIDYVRGEIDPSPKPRGGILMSWRKLREF